MIPSLPRPARLFVAVLLLTLAAQTVRAADVPATPWISLFNGTNLDGWTPMNDGKFSATNRVIHIAGGMGWLRSARTYTNFVLEAEWQGLESNYNSGFFIRCGIEGERFPTNGWQVNLKQADLGALLKNKDIVFSPKLPAVPPGVWKKFRMIAEGKNLSLEFDGRGMWTNQIDADSGYIGIQAEGKAMELRALRVQETPSVVLWDKLETPAPTPSPDRTPVLPEKVK